MHKILLKNKTVSKLFVGALMVSVIMPSAIIGFPVAVQANETDSETYISSSPYDNSNSSGILENDIKEDFEKITGETKLVNQLGETGSTENKSVENNTEKVDGYADTVTTNDTKDHYKNEKDNTLAQTEDGASTNHPIQTSSTGSITVCKMIVSEDNHIAIGPNDIPNGTFAVVLTGPDNQIVGIPTFNTRTFAPNRSFILRESGINDAECITYSGLNLYQTYRWTQESITNSQPGQWQNPKYNDQLTVNVESLTDFFDFDPTNFNADGEVAMSEQRTNRTLVILNRYNNLIPNTSPIITLLGDNPMTVVVGQTFSDPGATAYDKEDGDITSRITVSGNVNTGEIGAYTVTYTVIDNGGLIDTKTRTVNVVRGSSGGGGRNRSSGGRIATNPVAEPVKPGECFYLNDYLRQDLPNNTVEVLKLQNFLKYIENFSDLVPTGVFDDATRQAVSLFQERYFDDILAPWGHDKGTGFVYITTSKKIKEIFCQTKVTLDQYQIQEINQFRAFLATTKQLTSGQPVSDTTTGTTSPDIDILNNIDNLIGLTSPTGELSLIDDALKDNLKDNSIKDNSGIRALASAVFSLPQDGVSALQSLYFLLIALIAIYLAIEIIVGGMDTNKLTKYQIWSKKALGYIIGLTIAIIAAVWYKVFSIVLPLLVLTIASSAILIWSIFQKSESLTIITPPPKNKE